MYTTISLLLLFLISIFAILLYMKNKKERLAKLHNGICPSCLTETKRFKDENSGAMFSVSPIESRVLKGGGCSGVSDIEYSCNSCGLKEVHAEIAGRCGL
jgi:hypothetical protein